MVPMGIVNGTPVENHCLRVAFPAEQILLNQLLVLYD